MVCAVYRVSTKCVDVRCQRRAIYDKLSPRSSNHGSKSSNGPALTSHASFVATVRYDCYERVIRRLHRSCIMLRTDGFASIAFNRLWTDKKNFEKNRSPWHYYDCCCGNKHGIDIECPIQMWFKLISIQFTAWYSIFFGNGRCSVDHTIYVGWSAWLADCRIVNPDLRSSSSYYIFIFSTRLLPTEKKISFLSQKIIIHEIVRIDYIVNNKYMM